MVTARLPQDEIDIAVMHCATDLVAFDRDRLRLGADAQNPRCRAQVYESRRPAPTR